MTASPWQNFVATPYGGSFLLPHADQEYLFGFYLELPPQVRAHLAADETGHTLLSVLARHNIPEAQAPQIALAVWYAVVGQQDLTALPKLFPKALNLSPTTRKALAEDLTGEILAPVAEELQEYWQQTDRQGRALFTAYQGLPARVRTHLSSEAAEEKLRAVLQRHQLPAERGSGVAAGLFYTVTALRDFSLLPDLLASILELPADEAQALARDVEQEVLAPVKKDIEQYWQGAARGGRGSRRRGPSKTGLKKE
jgi:hypothetical protein